MKKRYQKWICLAALFNMFISSAQGTDWGLWYGTGTNQPPRGEDTIQTLAQYNAYFMGDPKEKKIYLTFDCGYENGNTAKILDILKKHHAPATFFMVGDFLDTASELAQRMHTEGHLVGNHTTHHPNMSKISTERFDRELKELATRYEQITKHKLDPFYRPPEGSYTYGNLKRAQDLGYHTILWSVAHADWDTNRQPAPVAAIKQLNSRIHPGAIVLLHVVSSTNAVILDELLTNWENQGYTFAYLPQLPRQANPPQTAKPSSNIFKINEKPVQFTAYSISDTNYIKLRDAAAALAGTSAAFNISYDTATQVVHIKQGENYQAVGGELTGIANVAAMQAYAATQPIEGAVGIKSAYQIDGTNYIQLRELIAMIGGSIRYDAETNTVQIKI